MRPPSLRLLPGLILSLMLGCTPAQSWVVGWGGVVFDTRWQEAPFVEIAAGWDHVVVRSADGRIAAWGHNSYGQCNVPALPASVAVAAGWSHTVALLHDGSVVAWGRNDAGQCEVPALPPGLSYVQIAAGLEHTVALRSDGSVAAWGSNAVGQCSIPALPPGFSYVRVIAGVQQTVLLRSDGAAIASGIAPVIPAMPVGLGFVHVAPGWDSFDAHSIGLRSDSSVVVWGGTNQFGQRNVPVLPSGLRYVAVAAGRKHCLALRSDGSIVGWGLNTSQQCNVPPLPTGLTWSEVAAAENYSAARRSDGRVMVWGDTSLGRANAPALPAGIACREVVAGGTQFTTFNVMRRSDGSVVVWGHNPNNLHGVATVTGCVALAAAGEGPNGYALALLDTGRIRGFGFNGDGQSGVPLPAGFVYTAMSAGPYHAAALCSDGTVVNWGRNNLGQGDVPVLPVGMSYRKVAVGSLFTLSLRSNGTLSAWGHNLHGQCNVPQPVPGLAFVDIAAGPEHALARRSDGSVIAWGRNHQSQCNVPALPPGLGYVQIAAGGDASVGYSVARRSDGAVVVWGGNDYQHHVVPPLPAGFAYGPLAVSGYQIVAPVVAASSYVPFGTGCAGSRGVTRLVATSLPRLGASLQLALDNLPVNTAFLWAGLSTTASGFGPLPLDGAAFGMPDCTLFTSIDVVTVVVGTGGRASWSMAIPDAPALLGARFHQQALVPDPAAGNGLHAVLSDAATALVGR